MEKVKQELVKACKLLSCLRLVDFIGHLSARIPGSELVVAKPRMVSWRKLTTNDLVVFDMNGRKIAGAYPLPLEKHIHTEIYKMRADIQSILHTHAFYCTLIATLGLELQMLNRDALLFAEGVPIWDDMRCLIDRYMLIDTEELGRSVAEKLGSKKAILLPHHGVITVGRNIAEACLNLYFLERAAKAQLIAASIKSNKPTPTRIALLKKTYAKSPLASLEWIEEVWNHLIKWYELDKENLMKK